MTPRWTPMRWPGSWREPAALDLIKAAGINHLLVDKDAALDSVRAQARRLGIEVSEPGAALPAVTVVKGLWPGVRMSRSGDPSAGPTGAPWVDSNGWRVRLARAMQPESHVWVEAAPRENALVDASSYLLAIADCAAYGGRWIISLDAALAAGIAARQPDALATWNQAAAAAQFFAARGEWTGYVPEALAGVISDFTGRNAVFSHELLNLLGRAGQQYRIIRRDRGSEAPLEGLRAVIYSDAEQPTAALRQRILAFVEKGGLLITGPGWGETPGASTTDGEHPRFTMRQLGLGRAAIAKAALSDPYMLASDSSILISHRYDLVRCWNAGAFGSYLTKTADGKRVLAQLLFYANRGPDAAAVRIAGNYRSARLWTLDQAMGRDIAFERQKDAVEVHLPQVSQYAALDLEV